VKKGEGLYFLNIFCRKCDACWTMKISGMIGPEDDEHKSMHIELNDENVHPNVRKQIEALAKDKDGEDNE